MEFDKTIYPKDTIVYYVKRDGFKYRPWFGIVDDQWFGKVSVHFLTEKRITKYRSAYFDGVTIEEIAKNHSYKNHKLPKEWVWDTKLLEEYVDEKEYADIKSALAKVNFDDPVSILQAYHDGWLVRRDDWENDKVNYEVTKDGYYFHVENRNGTWGHKEPSEQTMDLRDIYPDYESAAAEAKTRNDEFARQAALSDYDWSVEQIDRTIAKWRLMNGGVTEQSAKEAASIKKQLLEMKNVEDIETRTECGNFVWKYSHNTKWHTIVPEDC